MIYHEAFEAISVNFYRNVRNITKLNEQELRFGIFEKEKSWHNQYKDSAYIFIGKLFSAISTALFLRLFIFSFFVCKKIFLEMAKV